MTVGLTNRNTGSSRQVFTSERPAGNACRPSKLSTDYWIKRAGFLETTGSYLFFTNRNSSGDVGSALVRDAIDHACARLKVFKTFEYNWDGEGASPPNEEVIQSAISFLSRLQPWHPQPAATIDSDGLPIVEFRDEDTGLFGKLRFVTPTQVEFFAKNSGQAATFTKADLASEQAVKFLCNELQITLHP